MNGQGIKVTLGQNIRFLRFRKEYSQADLAEQADISVTFLSNIERGLKFPKPDILSRLGAALEVEVYELFKVDLFPEDSKDIVYHLAEDLSKNINLALQKVFRQYLR